MQILVSGFAKLVEPDRHAVVTGGGAGAIGAEQMVPPGQNLTVVAIGLAPRGGVAHPMHRRGRHDPSRHAVETVGKRDIAMPEQRQDRDTPGKKIVHRFGRRLLEPCFLHLIDALKDRLQRVRVVGGKRLTAGQAGDVHNHVGDFGLGNVDGLSIEYAGRRILLPGDLEAPGVVLV